VNLLTPFLAIGADSGCRDTDSIHINLLSFAANFDDFETWQGEGQ
jgi:hypothetical protein